MKTPKNNELLVAEALDTVHQLLAKCYEWGVNKGEITAEEATRAGAHTKRVCEEKGCASSPVVEECYTWEVHAFYFRNGEKLLCLMRIKICIYTDKIIQYSKCCYETTPN